MSLILAIDTSSTDIVACISDKGKVLWEERASAPQGHSKKLLSIIESGFQKTKLNLQTMDAFAATIGPGSFTGLRISLGTIKGFCYSTHKPAIAIPTFEALVHPCTEYKHVTAIVEARKDFVYVGSYFFDQTWKQEPPERMIPVSELKNMTFATMFIGSGCRKYTDFFPSNARFGNSEFDIVYGKSLSDIAYMKLTHKEVEDVFSLEPLYIQKTAAEGYV